MPSINCDTQLMRREDQSPDDLWKMPPPPSLLFESGQAQRFLTLRWTAWNRLCNRLGVHLHMRVAMRSVHATMLRASRDAVCVRTHIYACCDNSCVSTAHVVMLPAYARLELYVL